MVVEAKGVDEFPTENSVDKRTVKTGRAVREEGWVGGDVHPVQYSDRRLLHVGLT